MRIHETTKKVKSSQVSNLTKNIEVDTGDSRKRDIIVAGDATQLCSGQGGGETRGHEPGDHQ